MFALQANLNAGEVVRQDLKARLGTDLTVLDACNPLFHTDGAPIVQDTMSHKPVDFLWKVKL